MKVTYIDPLIPLNETTEETLTRLSDDIGTLTGLMNDSERIGHYYLAKMFNRARDTKVGQAKGIIALVATDGDRAADDRRFLLVRGDATAGVGPVFPRQRFQRSPGHLALTQ